MPVVQSIGHIVFMSLRRHTARRKDSAMKSPNDRISEHRLLEIYQRRYKELPKGKFKGFPGCWRLALAQSTAKNEHTYFFLTPARCALRAIFSPIDGFFSAADCSSGFVFCLYSHRSMIEHCGHFGLRATQT
jgi:hypothetical protein